MQSIMQIRLLKFKEIILSIWPVRNFLEELSTECPKGFSKVKKRKEKEKKCERNGNNEQRKKERQNEKGWFIFSIE